MKSNLIKLFAVMAIIGLVAVTGVIAGDNTITGEVDATGKVTVIKADDGETYVVMGQDLTEMNGKTVKATGTVADAQGGGKIITVIKFELVQ